MEHEFLNSYPKDDQRFSYSDSWLPSARQTVVVLVQRHPDPVLIVSINAGLYRVNHMTAFSNGYLSTIFFSCCLLFFLKYAPLLGTLSATIKN